MNRARLVAVLIAVVVAIAPAATALADEENTGAGWLGDISYVVDGGFRMSRWTPYAGVWHRLGLGFETQGLSSFDVNAIVSHKGIPFFLMVLERPFSPSAGQDEMLKENTAVESGIDKFVWGFALTALADIMEVDNPILRVLLSARVVGTRETFFGEARAIKTIDYAPLSATVSASSDGDVTVKGGKRIPAGAPISFKTRFNDLEITLAWPQADKERLFDFHLGYFSNEWRRPSEHKTIWYNTPLTPIVYETILSSKGVVAAVESMEREADGLKGHLAFHYGLNNEIITALDERYRDEADKRLWYASLLLNVWYNFRRGDEGQSKFYFTLGALYDVRGWTSRIDPMLMPQFPFVYFKSGVALDDVIKIYGRVGFKG